MPVVSASFIFLIKNIHALAGTIWRARPIEDIKPVLPSCPALFIHKLLSSHNVDALLAGKREAREPRPAGKPLKGRPSSSADIHSVEYVDPESCGVPIASTQMLMVAALL